MSGNPEQGRLVRRVELLEAKLARAERMLQNLPARWAKRPPAVSRVVQFTLANNQVVAANGTATRIDLDSDSESDGAYLYHGRVGLETSGGNQGAMTPPPGVYLVWYRFRAGVTRHNVSDITDATNASPIVLTTGTAHGFSAGQLVRVQGIAGNLAANGVHPLTAVTATTMTLGNTTGSGAYAGGGAADTAVLVPELPGQGAMYLRRKPDGGSYARVNASECLVNYPALMSQSLATTVRPMFSPPFLVEAEEDDEYELSLEVTSNSEDITLYGAGAFAPDDAGICCWEWLGPA